MPTSKTNWPKIFIFKGALLALGGGLICLVMAAILGLQVPRYITELGRSYGHNESFYKTIEILFTIFLAVYLNRVLYQLIINKYVQLLVQNIRNICYSKWLESKETLDSKKSQFDRYPMGEVLARLINDTESVRELITSGAFGILIDIFFVVSCLVGFIAINSTSGFFLTGIQIVAAIFLVWASRYMRDVFLSVRVSRGKMYREMANVMGGLEETHYTNHGEYASKKCTKHFDDFLNKQLKANVWDAGYYSVAESLYPILLAGVVLIFPYSQITEAAIILAIVDLIQRSIGPIKDIASRVASVQRAISGFQRIGEFLEDLPPIQEKTTESKDSFLEGDFRELQVNVKSFTYFQDNGRAPFQVQNISFIGKKGELIGIVGTSGSGKSTLLNILGGLIIPDEGDVTVLFSEGRYHSFPGDSLRNQDNYRGLVGIVSQDSHIFSASIAFNITLNEEIPEDFHDFWREALIQIPYLESWIHDPDKEIVKESLSLGQKQLLSALRACYLKKQVVLFDEISSALDSQLEQALRRAILLAQQHSLTLIVAHRMETIIQADKILVLEKGRLISSGNHQELVQRSPNYNNFLKEISQI